ncbi:MAG: hypothetical protein ACI4CX_06765 [Candidatus Weimeria sp.]
MKKNSFKRFLAVTLAAATALTFAPVSTLGLSGVVQAEAAVASTISYVGIYSHKAAAQDTLNLYTENSVNGKAVSSVTIKQGDALSIDITGLEASKGKVTVTDSVKTGNNTKDELAKATASAGADGKVALSWTAANTTAANLSTGKHTLTISSQYDDSATPADADKAAATLVVNVVEAPTAKNNEATISAADDLLTVSGTTTNFSSVNFTGKASSKESFYIDYATVAAQNTAVTGDLKFAMATGKTQPDGVTVSDDTIAITGIDASDGKNLTSLLKDVTIQGVAAGKYVLILHEGTATGDTVLAVSDPITVQTGYAFTNDSAVHGTFTEDATNAGPEDTVTITTTPDKGYEADTVTVTYPNKDGVATALTVKNTAANKYQFTVPTNIGSLMTATPADQKFTVDVTFKKSGTNSGSSDSTTYISANSDVFGGVTTSMIATDDTDYSLVNSDATFTLGSGSSKKTYTANQLKWYLTSDPTITPQNIKLSNSVAILTNSGENTVGKLDLHVANADDFAANANGQYIEGVYWDGADNTIVYSKQINVYATKGKTIKYSASTSKDKAGAEALNASDLFDGIELIGVNNKKLKGDDSVLTGAPRTTAVGTNRNFTAAFNDPTSKDDNGLKTSTFAANSGFTAQDGVYVEKYYVPYRDTNAASGSGYFVAEITVTVSVNAGPSIEVKEGNFSYSDPIVPADDRVIVLDLSKNKTFDIKGHTVSNMDNTTYEYSVDTLNVTVDKDGVATAAKVGTAVVTVTPKNSSGVKGTPVKLYFRVNQYANDDITVTGKDGDKATVLTTRQYNGNSYKLKSEEALAAAQVGYVQIEVTGKEAADVKEDLTVKGTGKLTFALADKAKNNESVDAKTGQIRISHAYLNSDDFVPYTFAVKVTSSETSTSALTTGYFYVVVDYADAQLTGLEKSYSIGTSQFNPTYYESWLDLTAGKDSKVKTNGIASVNYLTKYDDLDDANLYTDDDAAAFVGTNIIYRATTAGKTAHLLFATGNPSRKIGMKYQVVELKSVPGKSNYVTKVVNTATGKTIYEADGVTSGAAITIDKTTVLKVSVAYTPDASLNPREDPAFTIAGAGDDFNYNTTNLFVAATEDPKTYEVTLIPSQEGTQLITILPTSGRLTTSDYSLVDETDLNIAVKYDSSAATTKPSKVTGLKLSQKKGAKVSVKFNKVTTNATMRYYVQKKVSGKTSGKSIGSTKTTLSVKKGATVKVRVKAYYYDENGSKHVGAYSAWKTLKTDKK